MRESLAISAFAFGILLFSVPAASAQWIEDPGTGWINAAFYRHETSTVYDETGSRKEIFNDGHATTLSLFVTGALGLSRGVDAWVQVPVHRLAFDDNLDERLRTGIGDPRIFLRAGPELLGLSAFPLAVRGGVKFVGGDFPIDAEIIPLGQGQRDWELMMEAGRSFFPARRPQSAQRPGSRTGLFCHLAEIAVPVPDGSGHGTRSARSYTFSLLDRHLIA